MPPRGGRRRHRAPGRALSAAALRALGLRRTLGGRRVLDGVELEVGPGEVVGLLGPNGAGKSTCFKLIAGLDRADAGEVWLGDRRLDGLPLWRRVHLGLGYLAQEPSVFRGLTVAENVLVPLERRGEAGQLDALLEEAGLAHLRDAMAGSLSGGERRRLEIARCLASAPAVLLLDEPFSGVDPVAVADLQVRIRGLARRGIGVLLTDHAVREALGICDRAVLLDGGRPMVSGTPAEVAADPYARARYLGAGFRLEPTTGQG